MNEIWYVIREDNRQKACPLPLRSYAEAEGWIIRNSPLFPTKLWAMQERYLPNHDTFMKAVTGENALTK
jgi:hypothetical protein